MPTINNTALIVTGQLGVVVSTWGGDCVRFPSSFILRTLDSSQLPRLGSPSGGHLNTALETRQWQEADISMLSRIGGSVLGHADMQLQTSAIARAWAEDSTCEE